MKISEFQSSFRGNLLLSRDRSCRWLMWQVGNEVPGDFSWLLSSGVCWGKAEGTGVQLLCFPAAQNLMENTWPSSEPLMCHWNSVNVLCCGYGDKRFYGLLPLSSVLDLTTELSQCLWDCGAPPPKKYKILSLPNLIIWCAVSWAAQGSPQVTGTASVPREFAE